MLKTIQQELYCLFTYGTTSFGLFQRYGISVMRLADATKAYGACSDAMEFDYGHNGIWAWGDTPFEALIACVRAVDEKLISNAS